MKNRKLLLSGDRLKGENSDRIFFNYRYFFTYRGDTERIWLRSFSNAKLPENIPQYLIRSYLTGDGAQVVECLPYINGNEVGGQAAFKTALYRFNGIQRIAEGFVMP